MSEIYTTKEFKKVLLILGNGFDLNLEFKTSYNHFLSSLSTTDELNNNLIYELSLRNRTNWVDIEKELEDCAINNLSNIRIQNRSNNNFDRSYIFNKKDYEQLKSLLKKYLISEHKKQFEKSTITKNSYRLLLELCLREDTDLTILNFNYTSVVENLVDQISRYYRVDLSSRCKHIYVHGNLYNENYKYNDIVFGIEDNSKIKKEHNYLLKSFDRVNNTKTNISKLLNDSNEIYFYGYSLGETDTSYFDDFFKESCIYNDKIEEDDKKKITFYHYKEEGYTDLFDRIFTLTNRNMSKFKHFNDVEFKDSFEELKNR